MGWFGEDKAMDIISGVGSFIDEQQLTPEEQVKYKMEMFQHMTPYKLIQRIMVTIIMVHWMIWGSNCLLAVWVGYFKQDDYELLMKLTEYAGLEMVWGPTLAAVGLYLGGGLPIFSGKTNSKV